MRIVACDRQWLPRGPVLIRFHELADSGQFVCDVGDLALLGGLPDSKWCRRRDSNSRHSAWEAASGTGERQRPWPRDVAWPCGQVQGERLRTRFSSSRPSDRGLRCLTDPTCERTVGKRRSLHAAGCWTLERPVSGQDEGSRSRSTGDDRTPGGHLVRDRVTRQVEHRQGCQLVVADEKQRFAAGLRTP